MSSDVPVPQVTRTSADMVLAMLCGKELAFLEGKFGQHLANPVLKNDTGSWTYFYSILFQTCLPNNLKKVLYLLQVMPRI